MAVPDAFVSFYKNLNKDSIKLLKEVYHQEVEFVDPIGVHSGLEKVEAYFSHLLESTRLCTFDIQALICENNRAYARWVMTLQHPKLASGKTITLDGTSELLMQDGKIIKQTDFYDMGAMFYEHIPVLRSLVGFVKNKIKNYQETL